MVKPRVYKALLEWERKKSLDNFRRVYRECFTGGNFIWRTWRIIRNTITGRYAEMLEMYENSVDIQLALLKVNGQVAQIATCFFVSFYHLTNFSKFVIMGGRRTIELRRFYYTTEPRHLSIGKLHKFYNYFYPEFVHIAILTRTCGRCQLGRSTKLAAIFLCNLYNENFKKMLAFCREV